MKKVITLLFILLLTGCINGNRDFEAICTKQEQSTGFVEDISYKIYYNSKYNITKIIEKYNFKYSDDYGKQSFEASKLALKSYSKTKNYIVNTIKDTNQEYEIDLVLEVNKLTDEELKKIGVERYFYNQKNIYAKEMTCKNN